MAFLLCCRGPRPNSPPLFGPNSEQLRTLQPASVVSIALPSDTIPHRPAAGIDESQALRDIFGMSPSSHHGYQTAAKSSGSFDAKFKFSNDSPTKSRTKAQRSIDKLGHNIHQRLSQSRLSNHSSRKSMKDIKSTETTIHTRLLPNSHTSTGLDDLLGSRNVSEGGYDSDARGIQTPSWPKASTSSISLSPEYTTKVLNSLGDSSSKRSASLPHSPDYPVGGSHSPTNMSRTPPTTREPPNSTKACRAADINPPIRSRATSSPKKLATPQRDSFSALLQLQPRESPTDVLRRLSIRLANGTIKLPTTPELRAMRMPSIGEAMPEWRLSFAAPKRASSLHRGDVEVRQALKPRGDRMEQVKRDSAASDWTATDKHASLMSNLDPTLLQYISRYGYEEEPNQVAEAIRDVCGHERNASNAASDPENLSHAASSGLPVTPSAAARHVENKPAAWTSEERHHTRKARLQPGKESVHLFDMRISQRLATTSVLPTTSPSATDLGSQQQPMDSSSQSFGKHNRFPTFIGQTSGEHLRKPSNPKTRRLFESDDHTDGRKLHPKWKSAMSISSHPERPVCGAVVSRDDASSVYMSEPDFEGSDIKSIASQESRSQTNPNGSTHRQAHHLRGMCDSPKRDSLGHATSIENCNQISAARNANDARAKESKLSEDFDVRKRASRRKLLSGSGNTLANERMSMVDFLNKTDPEVDSHERMSEVDFVGALNRKLTSSMRKQRGINDDRRSDRSKASQGDLGDIQTEREQSTGIVSGKPNDDEEPARTDLRGRDECATTMWERALRTARQNSSPESSGRSFRSSFGQLPRKQSREQQYDVTRMSHDHIPGVWSTVPSRQSRSLSPNLEASGCRPKESFNLEKHRLLCVEAKKPLTRSASPARSIKPTKKSLLDIRRFTTAAHPSNNDTATSLPATMNKPAREFLAWARFPSYTRQERNGAAGNQDAVSTKDFSPPADTETSTRNCSKLSLMTQPNDINAHTPGSWRFLTFGHGRKKSRSMDFEMTVFSQKKKDKEKAKQNNAVFIMTRSLARWTRLYRSHSSDLRRFRAGHRSSVSKGGKVDFPELEIVPGYDGGTGCAGRVRMEQLGDFERKSRKEKKRESPRWRESESIKFQEKFAGSPTEGGANFVGRKVPGREMASEEGDSVGVKARNRSASDGSSFSGKFGPCAPTRMQDGASIEAAGMGTPWAEIYQDCLVKDDDDADSEKQPISSNFTLPAQDPIGADKLHLHVGHFSASGSGEPPGEDSYVSCSVSLSDDDVFACDGNHNNIGSSGNPGLPSQLPTSVDGPGDIRDTSRLRGIISMGGRSSGMEKRSVMSSELRDSTVDFRTQLEGEERRVREGLLRGEGI